MHMGLETNHAVSVVDELRSRGLVDVLRFSDIVIYIPLHFAIKANPVYVISN